MRNFNSTSSQGGNNRGGFRPGGRDSQRSSFPQKSWGERRPDNRETALYKAVCADCGEGCEIPFRPTQGKPVYCSACFENKGGPARERFPARGMSDRSPARASFEGNKGDEEVKKQLQAVNIKLERIIQLLEFHARIQSVQENAVVGKEIKNTPVAKEEKPSKKEAVVVKEKTAVEAKKAKAKKK